MLFSHFSLINSATFYLTKRYRYKFVGEVISDILDTKRIIHRLTLGFPKEMKKANSISIVPGIDSLIRSGNVTSKEHKRKDCLK